MAAEAPRAGDIWQSIYAITEAGSDAATARFWRATNRETGEAVVIRELPAFKANPREDAWRQLQSLAHPNLLPACASFHCEHHRYEVTAAPVGESLAAWRKRNVPDLAFIERLVASMADALRRLHARGVVHFGVQAETIFLRELPRETVFVLGGAEHATIYDQSGLIPMAVDPFVAPPEAAGLFQHSPGPGLCAWDWWQLGRTIQELILGQSVMANVLKRETVIRCPESLSRAEALLLERDASGLRAGAVELMGSLDPRIDVLLRGLLTSCADARWGASSVALWLDHQTVEHQYALARNERLFRLGDHLYTLPRAAEKLRDETDWTAVISHVWDVQRPGSLACFVAGSDAHTALQSRLVELREMASAFAFKGLNPDTVREMLTALALMEIAGQTLVWRGHRLAAEGLESVFGEAANGHDWLGLLQAFTVRPVLFLIERWDTAAAKQLGDFAQIISSAETLARQHCWLRDGDVAGRAQLWREALRPLATLRERAKSLHDRFACSTVPRVETLFKLATPTRSQLVTLVWLGEQSARHGFLTHAQWAEREHARLRLAVQEHVNVLNWLRLARALGAGPWWFGRWAVTVPCWLAFSAASLVLWPGPHWLALALVPWAIALAGRGVTNFWIRLTLRRLAPQIASWRFADGAERCSAELAALGVIGKPTGTQREIARLTGEIAKLNASHPATAAVATPHRFIGAWIGAAGSWLMVGGLIAAGVMHARHQPPSLAQFVSAWRPAPVAGSKGNPALGAGQAGESGSAANAAERAREQGPVKVSWPYKPGDEVQKLPVRETVEARGDQIRYLSDCTRKFLEPYKPETISTLIVMRVPTEQGFGVMLFDGKLGRIVSPRVYLLEYAPFPRSWVEIAGRAAIFIPE